VTAALSALTGMLAADVAPNDVVAIAKLTAKIPSINIANTAMEILIFFCIFIPASYISTGLL
jgi:hypothetical protein